MKKELLAQLLKIVGKRHKTVKKTNYFVGKLYTCLYVYSLYLRDSEVFEVRKKT